MLSFLARRCVGIVSVLVGIVIVTFIIVQLIPGDPARQLTGPEAPPEAIAQARRELGLDRPRLVQFGLYVARLARGDLGVSVLTRRPVLADLLDRYPATVELTIASLVASAIIGIPLGTAAAVGRGRWLDHASRLIALFGMSLPTFWLGLVLQWGAYGELGWLPVGSRAPWSRPGEALLHMVLPTITLSTVTLALLMRITRSAMLETLPQAFITTARSKGLSEWRVIGVHALRNAGPVIFTVIGLRLGTLFGGAVLTETVFSWPGVGLYAVQAVESKDFPAIMGFTLTLALLYTLVNLVVDISYGWLDPRMSQQEAA
ncbi:MAG: ABC transporter permease [Candidatus Rokuibacteriota bacterium]